MKVIACLCRLLLSFFACGSYSDRSRNSKLHNTDVAFGLSLMPKWRCWIMFIGQSRSEPAQSLFSASVDGIDPPGGRPVANGQLFGCVVIICDYSQRTGCISPEEGGGGQGGLFVLRLPPHPETM